jgi:hypothetical protein
MNLKQPVFTKWQAGNSADFVRRHRWFFEGSGHYDSFFMLLCVYVPWAFAIVFLRDILHDNSVLAIAFLIVMLAYMITAHIMIATALEEPRS